MVTLLYFLIIFDIGTAAKSDAEKSLLKSVRRILPPEAQVIQNYRHPDLLHTQNNSLQQNMELDIFCPSYNLAFEYQGKEHYQSYYRGLLPEQRKRDQEKQNECRARNITLIQVPYWWNDDVRSLAATIQHARPDIFLQ